MKSRYDRAWHLAWMLTLPLLLVGCDSMEVQGPEAELETDATVVAAKNGATVSGWQVVPGYQVAFTDDDACFGEPIAWDFWWDYKARLTVTPSGKVLIVAKVNDFGGSGLGQGTGDTYEIVRYQRNEVLHSFYPFDGHIVHHFQYRNTVTGEEAALREPFQVTPGPNNTIVINRQNSVYVCHG